MSVSFISMFKCVQLLKRSCSKALFVPRQWANFPSPYISVFRTTRVCLCKHASLTSRRWCKKHSTCLSLSHHSYMQWPPLIDTGSESFDQVMSCSRSPPVCRNNICIIRTLLLQKLHLHWSCGRDRQPVERAWLARCIVRHLTGALHLERFILEQGARRSLLGLLTAACFDVEQRKEMTL